MFHKNFIATYCEKKSTKITPCTIIICKPKKFVKKIPTAFYCDGEEVSV